MHNHVWHVMFCAVAKFEPVHNGRAGFVRGQRCVAWRVLSRAGLDLICMRAPQELRAATGMHVVEG